jgi:hypothetical protein
VERFAPNVGAVSAFVALCAQRASVDSVLDAGGHAMCRELLSGSRPVALVDPVCLWVYAAVVLVPTF